MGRHVRELLRIPVMSVSQSGHVQLYLNLHVTYGLENGMTRLWYCVVFFSGSVTIKESRSQVRPDPWRTWSKQAYTIEYMSCDKMLR